MTAGTFRSQPSAGKAGALALGLIHIEDALQRLTLGQVDAVVDSKGNAYLLRPAQEYLRGNEARLQALFETVPDVITVLDEGSIICYQSPAITRVLGYGVNELIGQSIFQLVHPDDLLEFERACSETIQKERVTTAIGFRHRAKNGSWCPLEATLGALRPAEALGAVLTFRPAIPRSAAEEIAHAGASLSKDRFLAMLSHELLTPLMPALLGVTVLEEDERFIEARSTLAMIRRNIELQSRLLGELVDFTAVGQHKMRMQFETIDVHEALRFALEICQYEITAAQIEVLVDLRATQYFVQVDSARLQQVMWNLIKNAVKFSTPGSSIIIVSANDLPGSITVKIIDHGIGIEAELLARIFDPFQQGGRASQMRYGGLGLGLFIAKGLVDAQHGTLTAASEGRGHGTTFCLNFETVPPPLGLESSMEFPPVHLLPEGTSS